MNSKDKSSNSSGEKLFNFLANIFSIRSLKSYLRKRIKEIILYDYLVYGDEARLQIAKTAVVNNALFNLSSGNVVIEDWVFFGHHVSVLTGTHDYQKFGRERQMATEATGRDVVIEEGAWIASNVTIIGPCTIGKHSVVAACSLVNYDIPPYTVVAGIPAKIIKQIAPVDTN